MAPSKRQSHRDDRERDGQAPGNESNKRQGRAKQTGIRVFPDVNKGVWMNEIVEQLIRTPVQEGIQSALQHYPSPRQILYPTGTSEGRGRALQLHFDKKLPPETYTRSNIVADDGTLLRISLRDAQNRIVGDSPLSSITVELCLLNGDFGSNGGSEDWTAEKFNASILHKARKDGQLLAGEKLIKLTDGVGEITHVNVTDISKWARSGKFKLGAKVVASTPDGANIREGISEAFKVKDERGKSYRRCGIRSMKDKVWHLGKTAKDGKRHKQLREHVIVTSKGMLQVHNDDPHLLEQDKASAVHEQDHTGQQPNAWQPYLSIESRDSELKSFCKDLEAGQGLQQLYFATAPQDFPVASTSTLHIGEAAHYEQMGIDELHPEGPLYSDPESFDLQLQRFLGMPDPDVIIPFDDEAECSNHSSAANKLSKEKAKTVWSKILNVVKFKLKLLCRALKKAKL